MSAQIRTSERLDSMEGRLVRLETKVDEGFAAVDERFAKVDERFARVDERFARVEGRLERIDSRFEQVDSKFNEMRRHFNAVAEGFRDQFNNLYDLLQAHIVKTDQRFEQVIALIQTSTAELRQTIELSYGSLDRRVSALERRARGRRKRR